MNRSGTHSEAATERGRWSSRRKTEVVLRILRGEALDALSRELGVTAATLAQWRRPATLLRRGGRSREPDGLARHRSPLWAAAHLPGAGDPALHALRGASARSAGASAAQARPQDGLDGC